MRLSAVYLEFVIEVFRPIGQGPFAGSVEHGSELWGSIKEVGNPSVAVGF